MRRLSNELVERYPNEQAATREGRAARLELARSADGIRESCVTQAVRLADVRRSRCHTVVAESVNEEAELPTGPTRKNPYVFQDLRHPLSDGSTATLRLPTSEAFQLLSRVRGGLWTVGIVFSYPFARNMASHVRFQCSARGKTPGSVASRRANQHANGQVRPTGLISRDLP